MTYDEKVLAFIRRWLGNIRTKPGDYTVAYAYKGDPKKLTLCKAYGSFNETMAESVLAPSWKAYINDDVLEKEVFDTLNELKEKVDRWHASKKVKKIVNLAKDFLKEDGYDTSVLNVKCNDTTKWVTIQATATDGPRTFVAEKMVTYEQVLTFCDPVDALVTIMGDLIKMAEDKIGDNMEPSEAINIINDMLRSPLLMPWQTEALGVAVKTMKEAIKK